MVLAKLDKNSVDSFFIYFFIDFDRRQVSFIGLIQAYFCTYDFCGLLQLAQSKTETETA